MAVAAECLINDMLRTVAMFWSRLENDYGCSICVEGGCKKFPDFQYHADAICKVDRSIIPRLDTLKRHLLTDVSTFGF